MVSVGWQMFFLALGSVALDGGQTAMWVIYSIPIYWFMAAVILARRPHCPTKGDLIAIRYGFCFILVWVVVSTWSFWAIKGLN